MSQPDSISAEELIAVLETLGFYRDSTTAHWFYNSDKFRRIGPSALFVDIEEATSFSLGIVRLALVRQELDSAALDRAIQAVLGR